MNTCFKCMIGMIHPFHDNGDVHEQDAHMFEGIDWFDEETKDRERIQDGTRG